MKFSKRAKKYIASMLIVVLASEILLPNIALALTTGPSQPEVQSFEPVGTTDMVDMFSGDFTYNIPLLDVEGYPVNISYHGGINMEQEASWVGLGWNINPGVINRNVRGIPDDFNGDVLSKELHIKGETDLRVGAGIGGEVIGFGDPDIWGGIYLDLGMNVNFSNYRGVSCDFSVAGGLNVHKVGSAGINIGIGSQTGASVNYNANLSYTIPQKLSKDMSLGVGASASQGYSTRTALSDVNWGFSLSLQDKIETKQNNSKYKYWATVGTSWAVSGSIPISMKNYIPVITNSSTMNSIYGRIKYGGELFWLFGYANINGMYSVLNYNDDGSRPSYGYLYMQNESIDNKSILDFTRDKDGMFNKTMQYLPCANMTYDIYSISGQGTGGVFRPYRNDFGSVYDPYTKSKSNSNSFSIEGGFDPNLFELGVDYTMSKTEMTSEPWKDYMRDFVPRTAGKTYEDVYFKQAGELTLVDPAYFSAIGGTNPIGPDEADGLPLIKPSSARDARGNLIYYFTAAEASVPGVGTNPNIISYMDDHFTGGATPAMEVISRIGTSPLQHKKDEISEIVQVQKDGKRFVYGIPAMNNVQKEVTFSVAPPDGGDLAAGLVTYYHDDDGTTNGKGRDNYYSSTETPAYAHCYLLTSVLSTDYVDVTGDGPTDDDLGSFTKFNYSLKEKDYRWKAPFSTTKAQYNPGFWSDPGDDKGSYLAGSREEWMLHSIETKNFIAEFYISPRSDGAGYGGPVVSTGEYNVSPYNSSTTPAASYELDSIKLYNKHDRFINGGNAVPIKTVFFTYDYSLCNGVPNGSGGKLTLKKIYFRYGNSDRSMLSPYQFDYSTFNPGYDLSLKDRWGNYKPLPSGTTNYEFPFVNQNDASNNTYASAWTLTGIYLPSGGYIKAKYESDDYAFVQDQVAGEMFVINGLGSGPDFNNGKELYRDKHNPYLYAYFTRRTASEIPALSFQDNYLSDLSCMYYNFNVKLAKDKSTYEQIKGYASIEAIGPCSDGVHGYLKFKSVTPTGGGAHLNPVTYTALNVGRYNLSNIVYPGTDPSSSPIHNILAGLKGAIEELGSIFRSPIVHLVKKKQGKDVNLDKSFVRLQSVGLRKKGGGQRVASLSFYDSWNEMTGGGVEQSATYGKAYDYTIDDPQYGTISSGVASYEPLVGGDENPLRKPVQYTVQNGSTFPPNDPIDLYQEMPIGETLFPPGSVGYRKVTVRSLNANVGRSSQGVDVYQFYTAKDFPIQVNTTAIDADPKNCYGLFSQENTMTAKQGFSLVFNDMHGKPKSVEHYVYYPQSNSMQPVNYQVYTYKQSGGKLDNNVSCLEYAPISQAMIVKNEQVGVEADVTLDTRHKNEKTHNMTLNFNLNVADVGIYLVPIPLVFPWWSNYQNEFKSATATKIIQQYGILDNVFSYNENATTTLKNELFDPVTGDVVVTSINNEYHDLEYTVNVPAYWAYTSMSPAYSNIKFEFVVDNIAIDSNYMGRIVVPGNVLRVGDEVVITYTLEGRLDTVIAWVMDGRRYEGTADPDINHICPGQQICCYNYLLPRFPANTSGWFNHEIIDSPHIKIIRSGMLNMLNENIESYTLLDNPTPGGTLQYYANELINIKAKTFSDSNTKIIRDYIINPDTVNPFVIGERGVYHVLSEYAYEGKRNYDNVDHVARYAGLFCAKRFYSNNSGNLNCIDFPYNYYMPDASPDLNWKRARTISKWSPNGKEVENIDAIGNYATSLYGYNQELPVAVASNARQGDIFADGFEDYGLLSPIQNILNFSASPFPSYFGTTTLAAPLYNILNTATSTSGLTISLVASHTGNNSLLVPGTSGSFSTPLIINTNSYPAVINHYNAYFPYGYSFRSKDEYLPFEICPGKNYVLSYWVKQTSAVNPVTYTIDPHCGVWVDGTFYSLATKSNIIDGWAQVETAFNVPSGVHAVSVELPRGYYVDDMRIFPSDANMKAFVYNPVNEKLMATLDENNFATMYEYDAEGNLVRVKKETEKGVMTVSESRSQNKKQ